MIELDKLDFRYKSAAVLQNVDLKLEEGNIYGLLGENGAGKTTLMKIILGLLEGEGGCTVGGYRPCDRLPGFLENIFFVPEDFAGGDMSVDEYAFSIGKFYPGWDEDAYIRYADELGVPRDRWFSRMSAGQQKKGIISIALALNTHVLLLDEPTNGMDIPSKSHLRRLISRCASQEKIFLISTHQVRDLEDLIDSVVVLGQKTVLLNRSVEEICRKLSFVSSPRWDKDALYCEAVPGGFVSVVPNTYAVEGRMNMEVFFNAVTGDPALFSSMF